MAAVSAANATRADMVWLGTDGVIEQYKEWYRQYQDVPDEPRTICVDDLHANTLTRIIRDELIDYRQDQTALLITPGTKPHPRQWPRHSPTTKTTSTSSTPTPAPTQSTPGETAHDLRNIRSHGKR
jgi:hypothetical protein